MNWDSRLNEIVAPELFQVNAVDIPNRLWKSAKNGVTPMFRERLDACNLDRNDLRVLERLGEWLMMIAVDERTAGYAGLLPFDPSAVLFATKWVESEYQECGEVAVGFDERGSVIVMPTREFLQELCDLYPRLSIVEIATSIAREIAMERLSEGGDHEGDGMSSEKEWQSYVKQLADFGFNVTTIESLAGDLLVNQSGRYLVADVHNELQHHYTYLDFTNSVMELLKQGISERVALSSKLSEMYVSLGANPRDIYRWLRDIGY